MKTLASFSRNKFTSLSANAQLKALDKLLAELEQAMMDPQALAALRDHVLECIGWMAEPLAQRVADLATALRGQANPYKLLQAADQFRFAGGQTFTDAQLSVIKGDGPHPDNPQARQRASRIILILDNLRSAFNVGSIFRSAECLGLAAVWLCGVTATPDHPALNKTAMNTAGKVPWRHFASTLEALDAALEEGYQLCALETTNLSRSAFEADFPLPLALVVGNESLGIEPEALAQCGLQVSLPVLGWKNSLNVGVACAVCAYQIVFGATYNPKSEE